MGIIDVFADRHEDRRHREEVNAREVRAAEMERARIREENRIRDEHLLFLTNQLITGNVTAAEINYLHTNPYSWKDVLLRIDANMARVLIENQFFFSSIIQKTLDSVMPVLKLKAFTFSNEVVQRSELNSLLLLAKQASQTDLLFVSKLDQFINKIDEELLNAKQTLCLQRIVDDYQIGLLGRSNLINNIIVNQLLATITLSQLKPRPVITQGLNITVDNFPVHRDMFIQRIASLPLNTENRITINEVILPGITTIIDDEQTIVDHVRDHHGRLYYLNEKLPLHTDHTSETDPEAYRQTLRRLLINFFGAAEMAHSKGRLNQFCEKICSGYCFEGRVGDVFAWVATLSNVLSFHDTMEQYFQKEYLPYAEIMADNSGDDVVIADPIIDFIMARHENAACLYDATYAPLGQFTLMGLKKYLLDIFSLVSQRDCEYALRKTRVLRQSLEQGCTFFWSSPWHAVKQTKIVALQALETRIEMGNELPGLVAKDIKEQHPVALNGFYSRTKNLLLELERVDGTRLTNAV